MLNTNEISKKLSKMVVDLREETLKSDCLYFRVSILDTISKLGYFFDYTDYKSLESAYQDSHFSGELTYTIFSLIFNEDYEGFHSFCKEREIYYKERFLANQKYSKEELLFEDDWIANDLPYNECLIKILLSKEQNEVTDLIASFYNYRYYNIKSEIVTSTHDLRSPDDRTYLGGYADNLMFHVLDDSVLFKAILLAN